MRINYTSCSTKLQQICGILWYLQRYRKKSCQWLLSFWRGKETWTSGTLIPKVSRKFHMTLSCIVLYRYFANRRIMKLSCTTVSIVFYYPVGRLWVKNSAYLLITDGFHSSLVYESKHATAFKAPCSEKQGAFPFLIPMAIICVSTYS